jgi:hypothetical protein
MDILRRFIETEDIKLLEKPIVFARRDAEYANYLCCLALPGWLGGISVCIVPYAMACQSKFVKDFDLQLDDHSVQLFEANNDCFCHIAKTRKLIPLDKIQDIQVGQDCVQTCCGVKGITILTGGSGGEFAGFLDSPDEVRTGISLAAKLVQTKSVPKAPNSMSQSGTGVLASRITTLEKLAQRGALSREELADLRVPFLSTERDLTPLLMEAADLRDAKALSQAEFDALKAKLIARLG